MHLMNLPGLKAATNSVVALTPFSEHSVINSSPHVECPGLCNSRMNELALGRARRHPVYSPGAASGSGVAGISCREGRRGHGQAGPRCPFRGSWSGYARVWLPLPTSLTSPRQ